MKECECEPGHSVAKLGHCSDCPHHRRDQKTQIVGGLGGCTLYDRHVDGSSHDFAWATYEDETTMTGVCRCGVRELDFDLARMP